jgi:hypothetical protein
VRPGKEGSPPVSHQYHLRVAEKKGKGRKKGRPERNQRELLRARIRILKK